MITEQEANVLMTKLIELRNNFNSISKDDTDYKAKKAELARHEQTCVEKMKYVVSMITARYKAFANYDDLNQDGLEALTKAMKNYNPAKGSVFWWVHKYVDTKIARSANLHTTIRYPLKVAREMTPHKEGKMPNQIETLRVPDQEYAQSELLNSIEMSMMKLSETQRKIVGSYFGITSTKNESLTKISKKVGMSRAAVSQELEKALELLKHSIKYY